MTQMHVYNFPAQASTEAIQWGSQWGSVTFFHYEPERQLGIFGFREPEERDRALRDLQAASRQELPLFLGNNNSSPACAAELDEAAGALLFVGQLDYIDDDQLRGLFSAFGVVKEIREIHRQLDPQLRRRWKRSVFVEMDSHSAALAAIKNLNERSLLGTGPIPVRLARRKTTQEADTKLFVGMLAAETTEQDLINLFAAFGSVTEATVMRTGSKSRGCGWVKLTTVDECTNAISTLNGRHYLRLTDAVKVSFAEDTSTRQAKRATKKHPSPSPTCEAAVQAARG